MPNAAASLDADFGFPSPDRRRARPASGRPGKKTKKHRAAVFDGMPRYGAMAISVLIGLGIVVNALMMQHGHHPAPLFGAPAADKAAARSSAVKPATRADIPSTGRTEQTVASVASSNVIEAPLARPAAKAIPEDAIARLLAGAPAAAASQRTKSMAERSGSPKQAAKTAAKIVAAKPGQDKRRKADD